MSHRTQILIAIIILTCSTSTSAAELTPFIENGQLGVVIKNPGYPEKLHKDLVSGLTNKVLIQVEVLTQGHTQSTEIRKVVEIAVKYEIWDEKFKVTKTEADGVTSQMLPSLNEVLIAISNIRIPKLMKVDGLGKNQEFRFNYAALLNPIDKEKMEKIKDWVIQNSSATPVDPTGFGASRNVAQARKNTLFNQIFEQYANGERVAAAWRENGESKSFRLSEMTP
jgi:hypothetical protein